VTAGTPGDELAARGCEVLPLNRSRDREGGGGEDPRSLTVAALLDELGRRRMTNVLVEGGAEVLGSFFDAGAVDEVHVFIAPRIAGGQEAKTPVGGRGVDKISEAMTLVEWDVEQLEGDVLLHGRMHSPTSGGA